MSAATEPKERLHFLDGLRAIAATLVVLLHSMETAVARIGAYLGMPVLGVAFKNFGQSGVVLFFVLSGVVLLRPYLRREKFLKINDYFLRRFKRLYPPYFTALVFACLVIYINNRFPTWYNIDGLHIQFSWYQAFKDLFIIGFYNFDYNPAWWSLGIEIVFYMLVPVIILIFPAPGKCTSRTIFLILFITLLSTIFLQLFLTNNYPWVYSYTYDTSSVIRFIEYPVCFLLGIFLAIKDFEIRNAILFICLGAILLIVSFYYQPIIHSGFGFLYTGVIILAFKVKSFRHFLSRPFMIWLGERSYSLFLIHFSVFYLVDNMVARFVTSRNITYFIFTRGIGLSLALFLAMLLFTFVEKRQARGLVTGEIFWPWGLRSIKKHKSKNLIAL